MPEPITHDDELLLNAYVDGELSPPEALAMERKLADDPALAALHVRLVRLRQRVVRSLPPMKAPPGLVARVNAATAPRTNRRDWMKMAASIAIAAAVGSGATFLALRDWHDEPVRDAVVANHMRALLASQPTDLASSERDAVKPWLAGRVAFAPAVADLTPAGFALVGGRVDVIGTTPSPTLVYRQGQRVVSLTEIKVSHGAKPPRPSEVGGLRVLYWSENGISYWAVSDLAPAELAAFSEAFRSATPNG